MASARISLIHPADGLVYKWERKRTKRMPLGLAYIAAALQRVGHDIKVVDGALHDLTNEEVADRALAHDPQFVGITCTTPLYPQAVDIIDRIKTRSPKTTVIIGGPHVSALPRATLETSRADFVCVGEGEESVVKIVDCVMNGGDPSEIVGISYNWGEYQGETTHYRRLVKERRDDHAPPIDLNLVPAPARELFEYAEYTDLARDYAGPQTMAMFSRGCPGKCAFCGAADTVVRFRELDNVFDELQSIEQLGIKNLGVNDDTYTSNKKRVLALSKGIVERDIKLNIAVQLRLDQLDQEICDAMFASGVTHVGPGIESGNANIIKAIGKGPRESKEHMRSKIRMLQGYDWKIRCSYVFGMPNETEEQILETIEFAKELGADENAFSILVPYPDSPLWAYAKAEGKVHDHMDFSKFLYYHEIGCNLSAVPTERLLELHEFAYEYVGNPAYNFDDDAVSSGNRPHIPYLASEAFKQHRDQAKDRLKEYAWDDYTRTFDAQAHDAATAADD
jgi:anaerobic magnesium-protoporphyrin IX monomethyl ester cyclase